VTAESIFWAREMPRSPASSAASADIAGGRGNCAEGYLERSQRTAESQIGWQGAEGMVVGARQCNAGVTGRR
jgi:hypothetical protein